jgi:hypothetical protein
MSFCIAVNSDVVLLNSGFFIREDNCHISIVTVDFYLRNSLEIVGKMIVKQEFQAGYNKDSLIPVDIDCSGWDNQFDIFCGFDILISGVFSDDLA